MSFSLAVSNKSRHCYPYSEDFQTSSVQKERPSNSYENILEDDVGILSQRAKAYVEDLITFRFQ